MAMPTPPPGVMADIDVSKLPQGVELKWIQLTEHDGFVLPIWPLLAAVLAAVAFVTCALGCLLSPPAEGAAERGPRRGALAGDPGHVALVVAHPDDEAMFFWPTLLRLREAGVGLSVLCLSTGNFDGLGDVRREEMRRSCSRLGIHGDALAVLDVEALQDGFWSWPEEVVAEKVREFVAARGARTVLTFDGLGVSGHPNHISASQGVRRARDELVAEGAAAFDVLMLESAPMYRKYVGALSSLVDALLEQPVAAACTFRHPFMCLRALACHRSQLVWYRVLFTLFSRYSYVNTYLRYAPRPRAPTPRAGAGAGAASDGADDTLVTGEKAPQTRADAGTTSEAVEAPKSPAGSAGSEVPRKRR